MRPVRELLFALATFPLAAVLAIGCSAETATPTTTPTAEMARYCLEDPLRAYTAGTDEGVAWALAEDVLYLHFLSARTVVIPAFAPGCGHEWRLVDLAGTIAPIVATSYSVVTTAGGTDDGFVFGFAAGPQVVQRLDFLRACAASPAAGSEPDLACATAAAVIAYGPVSSPAMSLLWPEDEQLAEWLANQPD
jgi:hypothetical protein